MARGPSSGSSLICCDELSAAPFTFVCMRRRFGCHLRVSSTLLMASSRLISTSPDRPGTLALGNLLITRPCTRTETFESAAHGAAAARLARSVEPRPHRAEARGHSLGAAQVASGTLRQCSRADRETMGFEPLRLISAAGRARDARRHRPRCRSAPTRLRRSWRTSSNARPRPVRSSWRKRRRCRPPDLPALGSPSGCAHLASRADLDARSGTPPRPP